MIKSKPVTDGIEILKRRYVNDPEMEAFLEEERANADIARNIYEMRKEAGLTQKELAVLAGTSRSVIARLEDADYEGHSLSMLRRVAAALNKQIRIDFIPLKTKAV